ncbi:MAG: PEP-CTERM sorting domain-containing protein [Rhodobacteraceae bacterium]|nr:PEP-CTERM sorting domain-containing protein [Paracoccaceae bacterium]
MMSRTIAFFFGVFIFAVAQANAAVVVFQRQPTVATTFADGTFSHHLTNQWDDGFYAYPGNPSTKAMNFYGINGLSIFFNSPVLLNSMVLEDLSNNSFNVNTLTVSLYDTLDSLLTSQTYSFAQLLLAPLATFNTAHVARISFDFTGGGNAYNDGRNAAWYLVSNITYSEDIVDDVPVPGAVALLGFGLLGLGVRRRVS